jgi:P4 family phage/plasmid primase-like protien
MTAPIPEALLLAAQEAGYGRSTVVREWAKFLAWHEKTNPGTPYREEDWTAAFAPKTKTRLKPTNGDAAQPPPTPTTGVRPRPFRFSRGSHVELARALLQQLESVADGKLKRPVYDEGSLYAYDVKQGIWARVGEIEAGKIVQSFDGSIVGKTALKLKESDIRGAMACARREAYVEGFFAAAPAGLTFKDVLVTAKSDGSVERLPHASDNLSRFAYDFDYTEEEPTQFLNALKGMFKPDKDADEKIQLLTEFAGVCLLGAATKLQRWILLKGGGDDGKSTLIDMIRSAMPTGSTCSIKPEKLEDEYDRADLAGKLLNTVTEVKQREVLDAETLKAVTAGDAMRGRHIREAPIDFKPRAGHIFAANGYPKFSDSSHGFWRRPIVITFNHRFTDDPAREVGLAERILSVERAEIVCWLVRHGAQALARGYYFEPKSHKRAIIEWRGETDAVFEFVEEKLFVTKKPTASIANDWSRPNDIYLAFLEWANKTGHKEMSSTAFGRRLTELGYAEGRAGGQRFRPLRLLRPGEVKRDDGNLAEN